MKIKHPMNEKDTYREHLQYNEKEQNVNNIVFDSCQFSNPCQNFVESHHPRYPRHILTHATYLKTLWSHATHSKVWPAAPTNPQHSRHLRYLADLNE